jgi:Tfp pilus assembly protein PilN
VAAPSATSFTVTGYAYTSDDVALLLQRLQLLPMLSNVTLSSTQTIALGLKSAVQFSLSAALGPTPAGVTP